jgi:hypothetical protein
MQHVHGTAAHCNAMMALSQDTSHQDCIILGTESIGQDNKALFQTSQKQKRNENEKQQRSWLMVLSGLSRHA